MPSSFPLGTLVGLCHRRWAIPILGLCAAAPGGGAKFVTFAHTLGLSRQTLSQTLDELIGLGLLARATGAGHPLRPEYVLTRLGSAAAPPCRAVLKELRRLKCEEDGLKKWSLPIVAALAGQPRRAARFGTIAAALPNATARALAAGLRELSAAGLVERSVLATYPPSAEYRLARPSVRLAAAVDRLVLELGSNPALRPETEDEGGFRLRKSA